MPDDKRALALAEESGDGGSSDEQLWCTGPGLTPEVQGELVEVEIPKSTHGAAILSIAQACDQHYTDELGTHQAFGRMANGIVLFILGGGIQIVLVGLLYFFSEERMQDPYEAVGTDVLAKDLRGALASGKALDQSHDAVQLCLKDHSVPWSQSMVSFVWLCKCVPHIVNAAWATWVLASLPSGSKTISSKMGKLNIVSLPLIPKMCAVIFIQLPLVFLDVALAIVGMKFLMYCNALGKLIVKAMSLSYIETVAGVVFAGLSSKAFQLEVNKTFLVHEFTKMPLYKLESWLSGLLKILCIAGLTIWYCRIKHGDLQDFRLACFQYKYQFVFPNCEHCGLDFFGLHLAN